MNVASLDLCRELYELSGWGNTEFGWWPGARRLPVQTARSAYEVPAYDLDYLLRKLPGVVELHHYATGDWSCDTDGFGFENADTPEDAACKLSIELFKHGVLTR